MKTIDLATAQNVTIEYELAGVRDRTLAFLLDLGVFGAAFVMFILVFSGLFETGTANPNIIFFMALFGLLAYFTGSEIVMNGRTLGKKAIGIRVVKLDGSPAQMSDYLLRTLLHFVDTFFSLGSIAVLLISSTDKSQRLGDLTAGTTVIRTRYDMRFQLADILRINSTDDYEPEHFGVRQFSEKDMLLIKNAILRHLRYPNRAHRAAIEEIVDIVCHKLDIRQRPKQPIEFLKGIIRDYIVLTR